MAQAFPPPIKALRQRKQKQPVRRPARGSGGGIRRRVRKPRVLVQREQVIGFLSAFGDATRGLGPISFLKVGSYTLLEHAVKRLSKCSGSIVIVAAEDAVPAIRNLIGSQAVVIPGRGFTLAAVKEQVRTAAVRVVAVHDVRWAFASARLMMQVLMAALETGAATAATQAPGAIVEYTEGMLTPVPGLERPHLSHCPQGYLYETLLEFTGRAGWGDKTLDTLWQFVGELGDEVTAVENEVTNVRITNPVELAVAQRIILPELQKRRGSATKPTPSAE